MEAALVRPSETVPQLRIKVLGPPEVLLGRIAILREAFDSTMRDPDFLAEMRALGLEVRPVGGAEVQSLMRDIHASPPDVLKLAREILVDTPPASPTTPGTGPR